MGSYVARRLLYAVLTFLGITIAVFTLVHAVPGDPITFYIGAHGAHNLSQATLQAIRHEHHLDEPLVTQYLYWLRGILPTFGMTSDEYLDLSTGQQLLDHARHLVLPVITLTFALIAIFARFTKSALSEVIRQDYITTARAKGAGPQNVLWRHAFRNALIPLITLLGLTIPYLISGSVIVEQVFQWDGIGHLFFQSVLRRDYPTVLGLTVISAVVTLLASVLADLM